VALGRGLSRSEAFFEALSQAITENDLERAVGTHIRSGDRLLLRTDHNNAYDGGSDKWMKASPYLTIGATEWCIRKGIVVHRACFIIRAR
jgi:kynurenine formamidase